MNSTGAGDGRHTWHPPLLIQDNLRDEIEDHFADLVARRQQILERINQIDARNAAAALQLAEQEAAREQRFAAAEERLAAEEAAFERVHRAFVAANPGHMIDEENEDESIEDIVNNIERQAEELTQSQQQNQQHQWNFNGGRTIKTDLAILFLLLTDSAPVILTNLVLSVIFTFIFTVTCVYTNFRENNMKDYLKFVRVSFYNSVIYIHVFCMCARLWVFAVIFCVHCMRQFAK